jgi:hypothetical protein
MSEDDGSSAALSDTDVLIVSAYKKFQFMKDWRPSANPQYWANYPSYLARLLPALVGIKPEKTGDFATEGYGEAATGGAGAHEVGEHAPMNPPSAPAPNTPPASQPTQSTPTTPTPEPATPAPEPATPTPYRYEPKEHD